MIDPLLKELLVCPRDKGSLQDEGEYLRCDMGHRYPVVDGIPIMLLDDVPQTHPEATRALDVEIAKSELKWDDGLTPPADVVDPIVQAVIGATCGHLYSPHRGRLAAYPIPELRISASTRGETFLDIGCNWGRWSIAASRKGYRVVGLDPSFGALVVARRVCRQLGVSPCFVVGDARFLPFRRAGFDVVFSYSVFQHFNKDDVRTALPDVARVLATSGTAMIQMPNRLGIRSLFHQARLAFRKPRNFDVRYWTLGEMRRAFAEDIGPSYVLVDGFFGLGIQPANVEMFSPAHRFVVHVSEALRAMARHVGIAAHFADSLYVVSRLPGQNAPTGQRLPR